MEKDIITYTFDCIGCGKCVSVCPHQALKLVNNGMCSFVNVIDVDLCNGCKKCERVCKVGAIKII
ncbi:MAG: 4Fe-4S binding protein [Bacteroidaceae bacterium]|nr:4Fe-4S binding protein [Bacteroidaceae bacterium]